MIKIINNFLPSDVFEEAHNLSNKVIKNPHITDPAGNHQHLLYSNYVWPDNIVHDSMPVLCHRIPTSSVIYKKISEAVYNQVEMQARVIQLYYWSVYSYIPWHDDGHQHAGLTIYLNKKWDRDDGGLFLYNEGDGIKGVGLVSLAKKFSFLAEEQRYTVDDVLEKCEANKEDGKIFENILAEKQKVYLNYQIMQLYQPNMSLQAQNKVDYVLENFIPEFNKTEFLKSSIMDGFADLNLNDLFTTFNRIISDDKSTT